MATKIRCSECRKKISVDEAFAGSMCRCPYCKAIVMVPKPEDFAAKSQGARPSRPAAGRPSSPTARKGASGGTGLRNVVGSRPIVEGFEKTSQEPVAEETLAVDAGNLSDEQLAAIPTASPILFQGVLALILVVIMLLMTGACVYLGVKIFSRPVEDISSYIAANDTLEPDLENPFLTGASSPVICGNVPIEAPVVYCIDAGSNMGEDMYPLARSSVFASIVSLGDSRKFGVVVLQEGSAVLIDGKMLPGGVAGVRAIKKKMLPVDEEGGTINIGGTTDLRLGIRKALACKPKPGTIVIIVSCRYIDNPKGIAAVIKNSKTKLMLVALGIDNEEQAKAIEVLAKESGENSQSVIYKTKEQLAEMFDNSNIPD